MCVMVTQDYMNFCDCYNDTSLRLSRYAYYTVMYTGCRNLMSNCLCKNAYDWIWPQILFNNRTCVETVSYGIYVLYIACLLPEYICEPAV